MTSNLLLRLTTVLVFGLASLGTSAAMAQDEVPADINPNISDELSEIEWTLPEGGLGEGAADDESLPRVYVIPMRGQMGTDIHPDAYVKVVEEIRKEQPDLVVWVMRCADIDELLISMVDPGERSLLLFEEYRRLVSMLRHELRDVRQVMWVEDSVGISSLVALAWEKVYMTPTARLGGLQGIYDIGRGFQDEDVRGKMIAAWVQIAVGFVNQGGRPILLGEAMINPTRQLSASWRGREVIWSGDTSGEIVVNASKRQTVNFRAKAAEDLGVVTGIAEDLDELLLLEGIREYRQIRGPADQHIRRYVEDWRRQYENTRRWWRDYQQKMGWARGEDTLRYLGAARNHIRDIINAMNRYPAIELRWGGPQVKFRLQTIEEQLAERIRALRSSGTGGGRRGPGGGLGGGRGG
jgi:hypothetical protein